MSFAHGKSAHYSVNYAGRTSDRVVRLDGEESVSDLFRYDLVVALEQEFLDATDILTKPILIQFFDDAGNTIRYVNGVITELQFLAQGKRFNQFRIRIEPLFCYLNFRSASRIFQQQTPTEIFRNVCRLAGIPSDQLEFNLKTDASPIEYCVQYNETDWSFLKRLSEQNGWYWYFEHSDKLHRMIVTDHREGHKPHQPKKITYQDFAGSRADQTHIYRFERHQSITSSHWVAQDFSPMKPNHRVEGHANDSVDDGFNQFMYPAWVNDSTDGERRAKTLLNGERARASRLVAFSTVRTLTAGNEVELVGHPLATLNQEYFVASVRHSATEPQVLEEDASEEGSSYRNILDLTDANLIFKNTLSTARPSIASYQTARVVGPENEKIYSDEYGRIKIRFHWDGSETTDEHNSCWVRVAHAWAGSQAGSVVIPRVGQEVVVQFENGNPDRPFVIGAVYNGVNRSHLNLPAQKTLSTFRSRSTNQSEFNEIRIEDQADTAGIFVESAKDWSRYICDDSKTEIGNDQHLFAKNNQFEMVEGDKHQYVKGDQAKKIDKTFSVEVLQDLLMKTSGDGAIDAKEFYIYADKIVLDGADEITLKSGDNFLKLDSSGVMIKGTMIKLNEGGNAGSGVKAKVLGVSAPKEVAPSRN